MLNAAPLGSFQQRVVAVQTKILTARPFVNVSYPYLYYIISALIFPTITQHNRDIDTSKFENRTTSGLILNNETMYLHTIRPVLTREIADDTTLR